MKTLYSCDMYRIYTVHTYKLVYIDIHVTKMTSWKPIKESTYHLDISGELYDWEGEVMELGRHRAKATSDVCQR